MSIQQPTAPSTSAGVSPRTTTETVTRTIPLKLETSRRKTERVRDCIDEWQSLLAEANDLFASIPEDRWGDTQRTWVTRLAKHTHPTDEISILSSVRNEAWKKISEAHGSWKARGKPGDSPRGNFGNGDYARFHNQGFEIAANDTGYGLKLKLEPYNPEWFAIDAGSYQRDYLERVVDGELHVGASELRLDGDQPYFHLVVDTAVDVYEPDSVPRYVGVDVGETVIYAASVLDATQTVHDVTMETGREFRHYRDRFDEKKDRLQEQGKLRELKKTRGERERYTEQVIDHCTRAVVDLAVEYEPCAIVCEEMGEYRETTDDPIHDWPRGMFAEKVAYKATEHGIPVEFVEPHYTSQTCRKCGHVAEENRSGTEFECLECGYEVHADVNAAMNISRCGMGIF